MKTLMTLCLAASVAVAAGSAHGAQSDDQAEFAEKMKRTSEQTRDERARLRQERKAARDAERSEAVQPTPRSEGKRRQHDLSGVDVQRSKVGNRNFVPKEAPAQKQDAEKQSEQAGEQPSRAARKVEQSLDKRPDSVRDRRDKAPPPG